MVASVIFIGASVGVGFTVLQSQRSAYQSVYQNAAFNAAQGFIEQMRSMTYAEIQNVYDNPNSASLSTESISFATGLVSADPLNFHVDGNGNWDPNAFDSKEIVVDVRKASDGSDREVKMKMRFALNIKDLAQDYPSGQEPLSAFELVLGYSYEALGADGSRWIDSNLTTVIANHEI